MRSSLQPILACLLAAACSACSSSEAPKKETSFPVAKAPPSRHDALYATLAAEARGLSFKDGDWLEDYGDAPYYGLAASHAIGDVARRDAAVTRARAQMAGELLKGDIQEMVMSALGTIEHVAATGDRSQLAALDDFVDRLERMASAFGWYLDLGGQVSWALKTYGPTAISALWDPLESTCRHASLSIL